MSESAEIAPSGRRYWFHVLPEATPLPTMGDITRQVAERHGLSPDELRSDRRFRRLAEARWEAWSIMYDQRWTHGGRRWSTPQIGAYFRRDHSTVVHGLHEYRRRMAERMAAE